MKTIANNTSINNTPVKMSPLWSKKEELVRDAQQGNRAAMEKLILRHQKWIYHVALKLTRNPQDADDVTQEVLLIVLTKISMYKGKSSFRTWLYRVIANYVINMEKKKSRKAVVFFNQLDRYSKNNPPVHIPDPNSREVDLPLVLEEVRILFMMGILLCLGLEQRLIFVLGDICGVNDVVGSRLFDISRANYRKKLSRARKSVYGFMRAKYGN